MYNRNENAKGMKLPKIQNAQQALKAHDSPEQNRKIAT